MAAPEKIGLESQGLAAQGLAAQGLAALGLQPAGMLRISKGQQERYVWPVHLPGWLALGWRVAASASAPAATPAVGIPSAGDRAAEPLAPIAPAADEPIGQDAATPAATPAATRGRDKRGRRRKEEMPPALAADTGISTASVSDASDSSDVSNSDGPGPDPIEPVLDAEPPAAASEEPDPDPAPDPGPDAAAAAADATADGELSLMALPDDLFDDEPLI